MKTYQQFLAGAIIAASVSQMAQAAAPDYREEGEILSCMDQATAAVNLPKAEDSFDRRKMMLTHAIRSADHRLDTINIAADFDKRSIGADDARYDYGVALSAEYFDYKAQIEMEKTVTFFFNRGALTAAVYEAERSEGWTPLDAQAREDFQQIEHMADTMALMFSVCMGADIYERADGGAIRPYEYIPAFR